ncbi:MAG: Do family serine endopeptidase [Bacteroidaceae bacterium]|nr:Do family serine endopeptidase [Bacteroidaceae bacterium]
MKMGIKNLFFGTAVVVASAAVASITTYKVIERNNKVEITETKTIGLPIQQAAFTQPSTPQQYIDLTDAADKSIHAVVHIKSTQNSKTQTIRRAPDIYDFFFGDGMGRQQEIRTQPRVGFGSGVILTEDGYIVTNHHVIDNADVIDVTLNDNRSFKGRLIGSDENTDLALIKIEVDEKLPALPVGNSDDLKIGEWVLAVGNPFNLTSTVTAGIVSAKARTLGVYNGGIESFIQTDAAINQGNSGGALVNAKGELVGINSVLTSPTGSYAGYGFAIPTSIMTKVVNDLKEYGTVQRAILGIMGGTVTSELAEEKDLGTVDGVYVSEVMADGGAQEAGIEVGDVIIAVDGTKIKNMAQMQEVFTKHQPGDKVKITVLRKKKEKELDVVLKNVQGNTNVVKNADLDMLGATFKELDEKELRLYKISYGLKVLDVSKGRFADAGIKKGFIIQKVNNTPMKSIDDIQKAIKQANASSDQVLFIAGVTPSGKRAYYSVDLSQE